jgi:hypothetical protein
LGKAELHGEQLCTWGTSSGLGFAAKATANKTHKPRIFTLRSQGRCCDRVPHGSYGCVRWSERLLQQMQEGVSDDAELDAYLRSRQKELRVYSDAELEAVRQMRLDKALVKSRTVQQVLEILRDGGRGLC